MPRDSPVPIGSQTFGPANVSPAVSTPNGQFIIRSVLVVEDDVEVLREHQLADDPMDLGVEVLHILRSARRLGDPIEEGLDLSTADARPRGTRVRRPALGVPRRRRERLRPSRRGLLGVRGPQLDPRLLPRISNSSTNVRLSVEPVMFVRV